MAGPPFETTDAHATRSLPTLPEPLSGIIAELGRWVDAHLHITTVAEPLYHYTSIAGCCGIISSDQVWHTSVEQMNDPKELKLTHDILAGLIPPRMRSDERAQLVLNGFMRSARNLTKWFRTYTASFSREAGGEYQWTEYGNKHRGACLVINPALFTPSGEAMGNRHPLEQVFVSDVRYGAHVAETELNAALDRVIEAVPSGILDGGYSKETVTAFAVELQKKLATSLIWTSLTTKETKWAQEREVRLIVSNDRRLLLPHQQRRRGKLRRIDYIAPSFVQACGQSIRAPGSLHKIIVGRDASAEDQEALMETLRHYGLEVSVERAAPTSA